MVMKSYRREDDLRHLHSLIEAYRNFGHISSLQDAKKFIDIILEQHPYDDSIKPYEHASLRRTNETPSRLLRRAEREALDD